MKRFSKFVRPSVALITLLTITLQLAVPFFARPQPALAGIPGLGYQLVDIVPWSQRNVLEEIRRIITDRLRLMLIRQIQRIVLDFFRQISTICPPYLRFRGTDICRKIVGDWERFFKDAVAAADIQLANEIGRSSMPAQWRSLLISALLPIDGQSIEARYTRSGGAAPPINTWENFVGALDPQRNILGQILSLHDEQIRRAQSNLAAALNEAQAGRGQIGDKECVQWVDIGAQELQCAQWRDRTPASTKDQLLAKSAGADLDYIISSRELWTIVSSLIDTLLNNVFGSVGLLDSTVPSLSNDPCAGLTGEALALCRSAAALTPGAPPSASPTPPASGISFTANPSSIPLGSSSVLSWAAATPGGTAVSCTASGGWSGARPSSGSEVVTPTVTTAYTLTCGADTATVIVTVVEPFLPVP